MYPMYAESIKLKPFTGPNDNSKPKNFFVNRKHFKKSHVTQIKTGLCFAAAFSCFLGLKRIS